MRSVLFFAYFAFEAMQWEGLPFQAPLCPQFAQAGIDEMYSKK